MGNGPSLTFTLPANADGSNPWQQARILATPDNTNNGDAHGRLYLQMRDLYDPGTGTGWNWRTGMMIQANGNVGVGTTAPGAKLEVDGNIKLTSGSGGSITFADGTTQTTAATTSSGGGTGGSYSTITQNGSSIGIGTSNPQNQLSVQNGLNIDQGSENTGFINNGSASGNGLTFGSGSGEGIASSRSSGAANPFGLDFYTEFIKRMSITQGGYVGIGTTSPQEKLHVAVPSLGEFSGTDATSMGSTLNLQGIDSGRTVGNGPSLTFSLPANSDGSSPWEQARILASPDNATTSNASGRMYLQVRDQYDPGTGGTWNWRTGLMIQANGNTGIGTTSPGARLEVNGNVKLTANSGASITFPDSTVQSTAWNGVLSGGDYAESVNVSGDREKYEPGDVLVIDPASEGAFLKSSAPYSTAVTGIYSTKPGVVGRRQLTTRTHMKEEVPMAMTGIVPTKVSVENGPIKPGDLLVTSSKPGYAMKGTDRSQMLGAVIGKAIGHLNSGVGVIEAVVTLQ